MARKFHAKEKFSSLPLREGPVEFSSQRKYYQSGRDFTEEELLRVHQLVRDAVLAIKGPQTRGNTDLRGELFTRLRQTLRPFLDDDFQQKDSGHVKEKFLFAGRLKDNLYQRRWTYIEKLAEELMQEKGDDTNDILSRMRILLNGMRSTVSEMESVNMRSAAVMNRVEEIHQLMEPETGSEGAMADG